MTKKAKLLFCLLLMLGIAAPAVVRALRGMDLTVHFKVIEYAAQVTAK